MDKKQVKHVRETGLFETLNYIVIVFILCSALVFFIKSDKVNRNFEAFNREKINSFVPTVGSVPELTDSEALDTTKSDPTTSISTVSESESIDQITTFIKRPDQTNLLHTFSRFVDPTIKYNPSKSYEDQLHRNVPIWIGENERVPFYVYNSSVFQWLENCKLDPKNRLEEHKQFKHGDDVLFAELVKNHPFRTFDPNEAKIFVIPIIWSYLYKYQNCRPPEDYTNNEVPEIMDFIERYRKNGNGEKSQLWHWENAVVHSLFKEPYFLTRGGHDHLMVASDFHIREPMALSNEFHTIMRNISYGFMEDWPNINFNEGKEYRYSSWSYWRCTVVVPYVDRVISHDFNPDFESWKKRRFTFFFAGQWDKRVGYYMRKVLAKVFNPQATLTKKHPGMYVRTSNMNQTRTVAFNPIDTNVEHCDLNTCLTENRCYGCHLNPEEKNNYTSWLADSRFALVIGGDTVSSSRLYDAIYSGSIPIVISDSLMECGMPFMQKVPWRDMVFFIPENTHTSVIQQQLDAIARYPENLLKVKFDNLIKFRDDVSWRSPNSKVVGNIMREVATRCLY